MCIPLRRFHAAAVAAAGGGAEGDADADAARRERGRASKDRLTTVIDTARKLWSILYIPHQTFDINATATVDINAEQA